MERLSAHEREMLLHQLHGYLAWVGAEIPYVFEIEGERVPLHELMWRLINKKDLTADETDEIKSLIHLLEKRESYDEIALSDENITKEEANNLYKEASGILRAIMDLKEIERGAQKEEDLRRRALRKKVRDARSLLKFVDEAV